MFDIKQQTALQSAAAAIIAFMIGLVGGMTFGAALVWGLLCGGIFLQLLRQNIYVREGTDILHGTMEGVRATAGIAHTSAVTRMPEETAEPEVAPAEPASERPATLDAPRDGRPDDLTQIDGIGPKISDALNEMGIYHFDQIAEWSEAQVAWIDKNLGAVSGRARRDNWVSQAKDLKT